MLLLLLPLFPGQESVPLSTFLGSSDEQLISFNTCLSHFPVFSKGLRIFYFTDLPKIILVAAYLSVTFSLIFHLFFSRGEGLATSFTSLGSSNAQLTYFNTFYSYFFPVFPRAKDLLLEDVVSCIICASREIILSEVFPPNYFHKRRR